MPKQSPSTDSADCTAGTQHAAAPPSCQLHMLCQRLFAMLSAPPDLLTACATLSCVQVTLIPRGQAKGLTWFIPGEQPAAGALLQPWAVRGCPERWTQEALGHQTAVQQPQGTAITRHRPPTPSPPRPSTPRRRRGPQPDQQAADLCAHRGRPGRPRRRGGHLR